MELCRRTVESLTMPLMDIQQNYHCPHGTNIDPRLPPQKEQNTIIYQLTYLLQKEH
jgi:hypothetical protein